MKLISSRPSTSNVYCSGCESSLTRSRQHLPSTIASYGSFSSIPTAPPGRSGLHPVNGYAASASARLLPGSLQMQLPATRAATGTREHQARSRKQRSPMPKYARARLRLTHLLVPNVRHTQSNNGNAPAPTTPASPVQRPHSMPTPGDGVDRQDGLDPPLTREGAPHGH